MARFKVTTVSHGEPYIQTHARTHTGWGIQRIRPAGILRRRKYEAIATLCACGFACCIAASAPTRSINPFKAVINCNAVVTCEIELLQNYFSLRRRPSEIVLFQRVELTSLKLFQNYFAGSLAPPLGVMSLEFRQDFWHRRTRVSGLSYGVVSLILGLAIFVQLRLVTDVRTDRQTDRQTDRRTDGHTMTANIALA